MAASSSNSSVVGAGDVTSSPRPKSSRPRRGVAESRHNGLHSSPLPTNRTRHVTTGGVAKPSAPRSKQKRERRYVYHTPSVKAAPATTATARTGPLLHRWWWWSLGRLRRCSRAPYARGNAATVRRAPGPNNPRRGGAPASLLLSASSDRALLFSLLFLFSPDARRGYISYLTLPWLAGLAKSRVESTTLGAIGGAWDGQPPRTFLLAFYFSGGAKRRSGPARAAFPAAVLTAVPCGASSARGRPLEESGAVKLI